jgi:F-type H+-transporting ATPase subunit b
LEASSLLALLKYPKNLMEILHQLGGLVLGSVPTMVFFILLVAAYGVLVRGPLDKTLAERRSRTSGAIEQARGAIAAAESETTLYEEKLRAARSEIMAARERRLKQWQAERDEAIAAARALSQDRVKVARAEIESLSVGARKQIEEATVQLSEQILRAVLPAGTRFSEAGQ